MTPRQKWLALLHGGPCPGPVCDYWATPEVTRRLLAELHCPDEKALWIKLGVEKCIFLALRHPRAREDTWHIPSLFSVWGVPTRKVPYLDGLGTYEEAVDPPLARAASVRDIETYPWPEPSEWDASELRGQCVQWTGYPIVGASYEPFYPYCRRRGMDRRELAAEFGHRVIFHGALDNQITLPFGTPGGRQTRGPGKPGDLLPGPRLYRCPLPQPSSEYAHGKHPRPLSSGGGIAAAVNLFPTRLPASPLPPVVPG
jgi:hypothetical protein